MEELKSPLNPATYITDVQRTTSIDPPKPAPIEPRPTMAFPMVPKSIKKIFKILTGDTVTEEKSNWLFKEISNLEIICIKWMESKYWYETITKKGYALNKEFLNGNSIVEKVQ